MSPSAYPKNQLCCSELSCSGGAPPTHENGLPSAHGSTGSPRAVGIPFALREPQAERAIYRAGRKQLRNLNKYYLYPRNSLPSFQVHFGEFRIQLFDASLTNISNHYQFLIGPPQHLADSGKAGPRQGVQRAR